MTLWETVIGLEVHAQLSTRSKLFSGAATQYGATPNAQTCFVDAALPGTLPVLNSEAVRMAIQFGFAINAEINNPSVFERKNYFYPDLPKGYQISQAKRPIVAHGKLSIVCPDGARKSVQIERAHLEDDAGKLTHDVCAQCSKIDLNRAGVPLLEIVTSPCLHSAEEAVAYLKTLHQLLRFLKICDGNLQEGSFRCDVNLSLRPTGSTTLGTRIELKNLNSFRFIEKAIHYEQQRQQECLESGIALHQQTRLYDPDNNITKVMRDKETQADYRYFPDPDLLPVYLSPDYLAELQRNLPELPEAIRARLTTHDRLNTEDIDFLLSSPATLAFYDAVKQNTIADSKLVINWLKGPYISALNDANVDFTHPLITAQDLAKLLDKLAEKQITHTAAKQLFTNLINDPANTMDALLHNAIQNKPSENTELLKQAIAIIIQEHPQQAAEFRAGKEKLLSFFVGQIMKKLQGKADPAIISELLKEALSDVHL